MRLSPVPLMLCLVLAACGGSDPEPSPDASSEPTAAATTDPGGGGDAELSSTPPPATNGSTTNSQDSSNRWTKRHVHRTEPGPFITTGKQRQSGAAMERTIRG